MDLNTEFENNIETDGLESGVDSVVDSERGASMVEYALLITFIAIVAVVALTALGVTVSGEFDAINSGIDS